MTGPSSIHSPHSTILNVENFVMWISNELSGNTITYGESQTLQAPYRTPSEHVADVSSMTLTRSPVSLAALRWFIMLVPFQDIPWRIQNSRQRLVARSSEVKDKAYADTLRISNRINEILEMSWNPGPVKPRTLSIYHSYRYPLRNSSIHTLSAMPSPNEEWGPGD